MVAASVVSVAAAAAAGGPCAAAGTAVTFESLLAEMIDRERAARWPEPAYACRQFSSYDRASVSPDDPDTWFANGDHSQYLREQVTAGRREWVMMDAPGPGAVVRIWSANPAGTLRVYLDGAPQPAIEAPMADVLGGRWRVAEPLSAERSRGWNLYLPIPYARHCTITSDQGRFYYQINYRTYAPGTEVRTFTPADPDSGRVAIERTQRALMDTAKHPDLPLLRGTLPPGGRRAFPVGGHGGPGAVVRLLLRLDAPDPEQALRSTVLTMRCDGEETIWCPAGAFFGADVGLREFHDWWRTVSADGTMSCRWIMPFRRECAVTLENLGGEPVTYAFAAESAPWSWDERSMYFRSTWRHEHPLHTQPRRDLNYLTVTGRGVYMGDSLAVTNPVPDWWGEGDEKIYVDGESFPSHFGTGTEDYYGYAWASPEPFMGPFHAQPRCDGHARGNNYGFTTVSRVRLLDTIPFGSALRVDMEVWHWKECDLALAPTTWFYASPGALVEPRPAPQEAARPIPQPPPLPPPYRVRGALECESLEILGSSPGVTVSPQGGFGPELWSDERQLFVQAQRVGDFIELEIPVEGPGPRRVEVHATRSWDYGVVRFLVNGRRCGPDLDLFNTAGRQVVATGPIPLGVFEPAGGRLVLHVEVVGSNGRSEAPGTYFGLDCVVLAAP
jgi:hypothetical protein